MAWTFNHFCLGHPFLFTWFFSYYNWLLLFCLLCSGFWPSLRLNVDVLQRWVLRYLLYSHSLFGDLIQPNGFKYHLDSDKPQIYVTSQDSPLTSRLICSAACLTSPFRRLRSISNLAFIRPNPWVSLQMCYTKFSPDRWRQVHPSSCVAQILESSLMLFLLSNSISNPPANPFDSAFKRYLSWIMARCYNFQCILSGPSHSHLESRLL